MSGDHMGGVGIVRDRPAAGGGNPDAAGSVPKHAAVSRGLSMRPTLFRLLAVPALAAGLAMTAAPAAQAQWHHGYGYGGGYGGGYYGRGYGGGWHRDGWHRGGRGAALLGGLAAGAVLGAVGASLANGYGPGYAAPPPPPPPVVYAPPPVVYAAPPPPVVYAAPPPPAYYQPY